jgi:hypothetical protein
MGDQGRRAARAARSDDEREAKKMERLANSALALSLAALVAGAAPAGA